MAKATISGFSEVTKGYSKKHKDETLESINIQRAANGFTVSCRHESKKKKSSNGAMCGPYIEPEQYLFTSAKDTAEFVEHLLGESDGDEG